MLVIKGNTMKVACFTAHWCIGNNSRRYRYTITAPRWNSGFYSLLNYTLINRLRQIDDKGFNIQVDVYIWACRIWYSGYGRSRKRIRKNKMEASERTMKQDKAQVSKIKMYEKTIQKKRRCLRKLNTNQRHWTKRTKNKLETIGRRCMTKSSRKKMNPRWIVWRKQRSERPGSICEG